MVPVIDKAGHSVALPTSALNKFGYGIDFDEQGKSDDLQIDFEAIAEHLYQITKIAKQENVGIALAIFDPRLRPLLFKTKRGAYLQQTLPWMKGNAWIRHDQHYHIDFSIPCRSLSS
jgi:penicillin-insensitive murein endopeptidase